MHVMCHFTDEEIEVLKKINLLRFTCPIHILDLHSQTNQETVKPDMSPESPCIPQAIVFSSLALLTQALDWVFLAVLLSTQLVLSWLKP